MRMATGMGGPEHILVASGSQTADDALRAAAAEVGATVAVDVPELQRRAGLGGQRREPAFAEPDRGLGERMAGRQRADDAVAAPPADVGAPIAVEVAEPDRPV